MDVIAIGCMAAIFCEYVVFSARARTAMQVLGAALMVFITLFRAQVGQYGLYKVGLDVTILGIGTALMLVSITQARKIGGFFSAPLRWFGRNSYEVYLTHAMVIFAILPLVRRFDADAHWTPLWYAAMVVFAGILGALIANYFSEPMNRKLRAKRGSEGALAKSAG